MSQLIQTSPPMGEISISAQPEWLIAREHLWLIGSLPTTFLAKVLIPVDVICLQMNMRSSIRKLNAQIGMPLAVSLKAIHRNRSLEDLLVIQPNLNTGLKTVKIWAFKMATMAHAVTRIGP